MAAVLVLGFASGLPLFLTSRTLQAWLTDANVNITTVGALSLVGLPYSLKFFWSPFLDRFVPPLLGRRRGWILLTQVFLVVAISLLAFQQPTKTLTGIVLFALLVAFLSATQDIAVDAYRTDVLEPLEMGAGAAINVLGYRIALLVTGSLALILADRLPWSTVYLLMAGVMTIGIIATIVAPEPEAESSPPASLDEAVVMPFREFFQRSGIGRAVAILGFIVLYRLGDALVNNMATPFLLKMNFTKTDLAYVQGGMGLLATIVGTLLGGAILSKLGINRSLWVFGGLQAASNLVYLALALVGRNYSLMIMAINVENFCGGLGTAAFVAFLMSLCDRRFSATQYALLSSLFAFSRDILVAPAGGLAELVGWAPFFAITIVLALPGLALLPIFAPWNLGGSHPKA